MKKNTKETQRPKKAKREAPCCGAVNTEAEQAADGRDGLEKRLKDLVSKSSDPCSTVKVSLDE